MATFEIHVPELADLANAIRDLAGTKHETPRPTTPVQSVPTPSIAPAQVAPAVVPTAPISPTQAYSNAPVAPAYPVTPKPAAPVSPVPNQAPQTAAPVAAAPAYTFEQIARAAGAVADSGKRQEVCDLITKAYGVATLSQIPKDKYGAFATALRGLGGRI